MEGRAADQLSLGVHAGRRVHPRADGRARLLGRGWILRSRSGRRRWDGQAGRGVDRRGDTEPRRVADHLRPLRRRVPGPVRTQSLVRPRSTSTYVRRQVPRARARGGAAAGASRRHIRVGRSSVRRSVRSRAGSVRTGSSRTPPAGDETLRPRGWAGRHWSPAIGAEHRARAARPPPSSTSRRSRRSRCRARAPPSCSSGSATTASPGTSARSPTRRC